MDTTPEEGVTPPPAEAPQEVPVATGALEIEPPPAGWQEQMQSVQSRLEQALAENANLKEQLALHQAAANADAAGVLKQVAALVAPFA